MMIHDLGLQTPRRQRKRVGRGIGSGHGKTSGRGHKGAGSRSGHKNRVGFEGGQMPLIRRVAKRGFSNRQFAQTAAEINLKDLEAAFEAGSVVDLVALRKHGLASNGKISVRILGDGELTKKLTVHANHFSRSAEEAIVAKGGQAIRVGLGEAVAQ
ncbi:50S ribosomal protein L15 [Schlesneria paludicola]|uniref:50S ribosomal protein L15 n=1 Tax=Schlesneria paludicola TaxID=360056 RepID=UPI00029A59D5|nr:50S ribosomal protein L15 [Schlesneria paludicola]